MSLGAGLAARDDRSAELVHQLGRFSFMRAHLDPNSIGPVLPTPPKELTNRETALAGAAVVVTALAKYAPNTFEKLTHFTLGVGINPLKGTVRPGPLLITWLFPQPVGLVPPEWGGIKKSWYLPDAVLKDLPEWVPGSDQARIDTENKRSAAISLHKDQQLGIWKERIASFTDKQLESFLPRLADPNDVFAGRNPEAIAHLVREEMRERAKAYVAKATPTPNTTPTTTPGVPTVPPQPQPIAPIGPVVPGQQQSNSLPAAPAVPGPVIVIGPIVPGQQPTVGVTGPVIVIDPNKLLPDLNPRPREKLIPFIRPTPNGPEIDNLIVLLVNDP